MKNMKVSMKLITGFLIAAFLTAVVGIVGIVGMMQINNALSAMYDNQTVPMPYMTKIIEMMQRQRACMREYIVGSAIILEADDEPDEIEAELERKQGIELIEDARNRVDSYAKIMEENMNAYRASITPGHAAEALFDEARSLYEKRFGECLELIYNQAKTGKPAHELYDLMVQYTDDINKAVDNFDQCLSMKVEVAKTANTDGDDLFKLLLAAIIIVLVAAVVIAIVLAFYISGLISKPLVTISKYFKKAGTTGNLSLQPENVKLIEELTKRKDEFRDLSEGAASFVGHVTHIAGELTEVARGNLTVELEVLSDEDTLGVSIKDVVTNLNNMFHEIQTASSQVSSGSSQVADGAQALASGSTQQAATLQELSASISEIAAKTKENSERTNNASHLANSIMQNAEKGNRQMDEMIKAVGDINESSQNISKVIKVIDDIAFQTNILALNAAVEAARAGQHGKGFAVVAEEVRNLASKSAEAAKNTSGMIADSMKKAELGSQIASETAESLNEIVSGISESSQIIGEIARSSEEQNSAIGQINTAISNVTQVVQQNSATAEQSAAASQEMSGQGVILEDLISKFKLLD